MKEQAENGCVPVEGSETTRVLGSGCHWRVHLQQQRRPRSVLATRAGGEGGGDRNRQRSALCAARLRHRSGQRSSSLHPRESGAGNTHRQRIVGSARGGKGLWEVSAHCSDAGFAGSLRPRSSATPSSALSAGPAQQQVRIGKRVGKSLCKWSLPGPMTTGSSGCGALWTFAAWSRLPL